MVNEILDCGAQILGNLEVMNLWMVFKTTETEWLSEGEYKKRIVVNQGFLCVSCFPPPRTGS